MNKLLVLIDKYDGFTEKYLSGLLSGFNIEDEVHLYSIPERVTDLMGSAHVIYSQKSAYFLKTSSPAVYEEFFEYIALNQYDRIIIPRLHFFEYFIIELVSQVNSELPPISCVFFGINEIDKNARQRYLVTVLLDNNVNNRIILHSIGWESLRFSDVLREYYDNSTIIPLPEPIYDNPDFFRGFDEKESRTLLKISNESFVILFFGSMFYGKGLDLLLDAFDFLPMNYLLLIASDSTTLNMDFDLKRLEHPRIRFVDSFIPESDVPIYFSAANAVCLPYRASYLNGSSGVFGQAALTGKPVCVPNLAPFNRLVTNFNLGTIFEAGDSLSLANSLIEITQESVNHSVNWGTYRESLMEWYEMVPKFLLTIPE